MIYRDVLMLCNAFFLRVHHNSGVDDPSNFCFLGIVSNPVARGTSFIGSKSFLGAFSGYVFRAGREGLGYYADEAMLSRKRRHVEVDVGKSTTHLLYDEAKPSKKKKKKKMKRKGKQAGGRQTKRGKRRR